jgi:uncharacterized protein
MISKEIILMMQLYQRLDEQVLELQKKTGLACMEGCGHCCYKKRVDVTPLELIPLAEYLVKENSLDYWLDLLQAPNQHDTCVFYKPNLDNPEMGRCQVYPFRTCLCRLFGFALLKNRFNESYLATCTIQKKQFPEVVKTAKAYAKTCSTVPSLLDYRFVLYEINPTLGSKYMHINDAARWVFDWVGLTYQYQKFR